MESEWDFWGMVEMSWTFWEFDGKYMETEWNLWKYSSEHPEKDNMSVDINGFSLTDKQIWFNYGSAYPTIMGGFIGIWSIID